jgi:hypothetical protein
MDIAAELGINPNYVWMLERDTLNKLALLAEDPRYAPLRWRAVALACRQAQAAPDGDASNNGNGNESVTDRLLAWLASAPRHR